MVTNKEIFIGVAGLAAGVALTIGTQKAVKSFKNRAAQKKADLLASESKSGKEEIPGKGVTPSKEETLDKKAKDVLTRFDGESDSEYKARLEQVIVSAETEKKKN